MGFFFRRHVDLNLPVLPQVILTSEEIERNRQASIWFNQHANNLSCTFDEERGSLRFFTPHAALTLAAPREEAGQVYALTRLGRPYLTARLAPTGQILILACLEKWNLYLRSNGAEFID